MRRTSNIFFSSCQCRRDILEVINFCFIWIARDLRQWTNQLDKIVNDFIVVCLYKYVSAQSLHESDSRIRALSILLYSSTITFDAQSRAETKSLEHEVFFYWRFFEKRNLQKERDQSNTMSFSLIEVRIWNFSLKIIRTRITFFNEIRIRRRTCFWIWFDFCIVAWFHRNDLIFAFLLDRIEMIWFLHFCLIASKCFDFCIFAWSHQNDLKNHYSRDLRIWQTRIDRNVCKNRQTYFFFNHFLIKSFE